MDRLPRIIEGDDEHPLWRAVCAAPGNPGLALLRSMEAAVLQRQPHTAPCLDVGCGDGFVARLLRNPPAVGLDRDPARCHAARSRGSHRLVLRADLCRIPAPDDAFATVIVNSVIEHVPDWTRALAELRRILRPGGRLLFTAPGIRKRDYLFFGRSDVAAGDGTGYREYFDRRWDHVRYADAETWRGALGAAGLDVVELFPYECPATSELVDLLMNVRLRFVDWTARADDGGHAWRRAAFTLLLPYFEKGLRRDPDGAAVFLAATK